MSWLSQATGIHWGNVVKPITKVLSFIPGLSTVGNILNTVTDIGNKYGGGTPGGSGGASGGGGSSPIGNIYDANGNIDWGQLANIGLGGMDAYNAAKSGQKANSLLNKGIGQYNDNWNQGKDLILNPPKIGFVSQASNPFSADAALPAVGPDVQSQALQQLLAQQKAAQIAAPTPSKP